MTSLFDPCSETVLDPLTLDDMIVSVKGGQDSQSFTEVEDSLGKVEGDTLFCGPRVYELLTDFPFVTFDHITRTFNVES